LEPRHVCGAAGGAFYEKSAGGPGFWSRRGSDELRDELAIIGRRIEEALIVG